MIPVIGQINHESLALKGLGKDPAHALFVIGYKDSV
jgi:hypothetical protein